MLLSIVLITLDIKNIKHRLASQEEIISELRAIHIQMDDSQLYQIFWSFLLVYVVSIACYSLCVIISIVYDTTRIIKYTFRLLMFILIYQFIETILRRYDFILIFLRIVMILLLKIWISLSIRLKIILLIHPEFASLQILNNIPLFSGRNINVNN